MYSIRTVVSYPQRVMLSLDETPKDTKLALEGGVSVALLRIFDEVDVREVSIARDRREDRSDYTTVVVCYCPDGANSPLPYSLHQAERMAESGVRVLLSQVLGVECTVSVEIKYFRPLDEWDDVLRDIA
ncbi:MAG TPA: hypothetical protein VF818_06375 [Ktedonobacterales bacterium]